MALKKTCKAGINSSLVRIFKAIAASCLYCLVSVLYNLWAVDVQELVHKAQCWFEAVKAKEILVLLNKITQRILLLSPLEFYHADNLST